MSRKLTIEYIKLYFTDNNYTLTSTEYINTRTKLKFICPNGHEGEITFGSFQQGRRCIECGYIKTANSKRHSYEDVKQYFLKHYCELLSKEYKNANTPLYYKCSCGNISKISFSSFKAGHRCVKCAGLEKITPEYAKQYFEDNGCKMTGEFINSHTPVEYVCSCGRKSKTTLNHFKQGVRCITCGRKKSSDYRSGKNHYSYNPNREEVEDNQFWYNKIRGILRNCLNRLEKSKEGHTIDILGYSAKDLQNHIENHPNWVNVKDGKWHTDHIFPVKAFIEHGLIDGKYIKLINGLDNLQPLSEYDNESKGCIYIEEKFLAYCKKHGVIINAN